MYNEFKIKGDIVECYSKKGELLYFTDACLFEKIKDLKWYKYAKDYSSTLINNKTVSLHRYLLNAPKGTIVDHINRNTKDNRLSNLRICDKSENAFNSKVRSTNKSGVTGVRYSKPMKKWWAEITHNKKAIYLGCYETKEEAIRVRKEAEIKYRNL